MLTGAPVVNPYDPSGVARSIQDAVYMAPAQRFRACLENDEVCL